MVTFTAFLPGLTKDSFQTNPYLTLVTEQATAAGGSEDVASVMLVEEVGASARKLLAQEAGINVHTRVDFPAGQAAASAQLVANLQASSAWLTSAYGPTATLSGVRNG